MVEARRGLLPGLHGLRAAAAMSVLLFHLHAIPPLPVPQHLPWIATHFGLGVHLFFALSAFSLAWANPDATTRPGPYLVKRFFRIAPLYWLLVTLILLVHWPGIGRAAAEFGFVFNFIPGWQDGLVPAGWTVGVEMPFYLALLLLLRIRSVGGMALAAALATLLSWKSRLWLQATMPGSVYADVALASNAWVFVLALLAYRIFERVRGTAREGVVAGAAAALALGLLVFLLSPLAAPLANVPGKLDLLLFGVPFSALCLWQALRPSWLMRCRPALWLGERSYSIYLAHSVLIRALQPAYAWITDMLGQGGPAFLACTAITLPPLCLAAALGYRLVEQPGMALGRALITRLAPPRTVAGAPVAER